MIYLVSDVHGKLDRLKRLLKEIKLKEEDTLYILGDMVDRGEDSIGLIQFVMKHKNIEVIMGNHDKMMLGTLYYNDEVEQRRWEKNNNKKVLEDFERLNEDEKKEILEFLKSLEYFKVCGDYLLVHAGVHVDMLKEELGDDLNGRIDFTHERVVAAMKKQEKELIWIREEFIKNKGLEGYTIVFGHTPRYYLDKYFEIESEGPFEIWKDPIYKDKICIDTGNCYDGGRMACLRLDDMKEYYID